MVCGLLALVVFSLRERMRGESFSFILLLLSLLLFPYSCLAPFYTHLLPSSFSPSLSLCPYIKDGQVGTTPRSVRNKTKSSPAIPYLWNKPTLLMPLLCCFYRFFFFSLSLPFANEIIRKEKWCVVCAWMEQQRIKIEKVLELEEEKK